MIPIWARVGAKVVCIGTDDIFLSGSMPHPTDPVPGGTYTINYTETKVRRLWIGFIECDPQGVWCSSNFRPLVSQADDISTHFSMDQYTKAPAHVGGTFVSKRERVL